MNDQSRKIKYFEIIVRFIGQNAAVDRRITSQSLKEAFKDLTEFLEGREDCIEYFALTPVYESDVRHLKLVTNLTLVPSLTELKTDPTKH